MKNHSRIDISKPIRLSDHAILSSSKRGATEVEIVVVTVKVYYGEEVKP